ncbi:MAG: DAK2 domain-containing protein [Clostridia bacterium]|nr:DAK2 domain-containing protein [Clostridia bacterium]
MKKTVNGTEFKFAVISGANNIINRKKEVDALNVFPVPDGDTGTNMSMTIGSAARELEHIFDHSLDAVSSKTAAALLRGARGNSGVILSLIFRGMSKGFKGESEADGKALAKALSYGSESAYKAVMKPTEGTILTVIRRAAEAVKGTEEESFIKVLKAAYNGAAQALSETPELLPVLKKSGVVDAGGQGLVYVLEGMLAYLESGEIIPNNEASGEGESDTHKSIVAAASDDIEFGYCSEFLINKENGTSADAKGLKAYLESIGDCVVVVEDEDIIKVHVHSNEPGNVIQAALKCGPLTNIKIDNMRFQHRNADVGIENKKNKAPKPKAEKSAEPEKEYGFVAVAAGDGFAELLSELGADSVVSGGQTMNPSTEDILRAVNATPAKKVFVLPNNKNIIMAAEQTVNLSDRQVYVLPTVTVPQGIAALLSFTKADDPELVMTEMMKAANRVHTAQVTFAAKDSELFEQVVKKGQILGMEDGKITLVENDIVSAAYRTARHLVKKHNGSLITVYYGEDVDEGMAEQLEKRLSERFPSAEVVCVNAGQPVYYFIVSVE